MKYINKKTIPFELFFILLTAFVTILICSKSSPLYPINDWVDANCYMTVGRGMLHGSMPYRDLFEHKGPLIYMLHAAAALISDNSFLGVFLSEIILCFLFLYASYRILLSVCNGRPLCVIPLISMIIYSCAAFCHGDSAEELCQPLLLCSFLIGLGCVQRNAHLTRREALIIGILSGAVLWTKFTMLGFYIGFFIAISVLTIKKQGFSTLLRSCCFIAVGVAAVTLPIIVFFAVNNSLGSLFEVYFYDNIFIYGGSSASVTDNLINGFFFCRDFFTLPFVIIITGILIMYLKKNYRELFYFLCSFLSAYLMVFGGGKSYRYYPFALAFFVPFSAALIFSCAEKRLNCITKKKNLFSVSCPLSLALCTAGCYLFSPNVYLMKYEKNELPQYKFAEIISHSDNPTLLNYGFLDGGFYLSSGITPDFKYFCLNNTGLEEMVQSQQFYVENALAEYVVVRSTDSKPHEDFRHYTCIASAEMPYYDKYFYYFLYKKSSLS